MNYLFTRLPFEVPFSGAEFLDPSEVTKIVGEITPQEGFVNWFFGLSANSLRSFDGTHLLTEVDGSLTKEWGSNYVKLPANAGALKNGLASEYGDNNSYTMCCVIKYAGQPSHVLLGGVALTTGEAVQMSRGGELGFTYKNTNGSTVFNALPVPAGLAVGSNIFIAVTRSGNSVTAFVGGASTKLTLASAQKNVGSTIKIGVGNTAFRDTNVPEFSKELQCYEFLYAAAPKTAAELDEIYVAAKARCAKRGVEVV